MQHKLVKCPLTGAGCGMKLASKPQASWKLKAMLAQVVPQCLAACPRC